MTDENLKKAREIIQHYFDLTSQIPLGGIRGTARHWLIENGGNGKNPSRARLRDMDSLPKLTDFQKKIFKVYYTDAFTGDDFDAAFKAAIRSSESVDRHATEHHILKENEIPPQKHEIICPSCNGRGQQYHNYHAGDFDPGGWKTCGLCNGMKNLPVYKKIKGLKMTKDKITRGSGDVFKDIGISEVQAIRTLLKKTSPDDVDATKEIDARVFCYIENILFDKSKLAWVGRPENKQWVYEMTVEPRPITKTIKIYTRSCDALKSIRPAGWTTSLHNNIIMRSDGPQKWQCQMTKYGDFALKEKCEAIRFSGDMPSEEYAELDVIIQALEYEREKNDQRKPD